MPRTCFACLSSRFSTRLPLVLIAIVVFASASSAQTPGAGVPEFGEARDFDPATVYGVIAKMKNEKPDFTAIALQNRAYQRANEFDKQQTLDTLVATADKAFESVETRGIFFRLRNTSEFGRYDFQNQRFELQLMRPGSYFPVGGPTYGKLPVNVNTAIELTNMDDFRYWSFSPEAAKKFVDGQRGGRRVDVRLVIQPTETGEIRGRYNRMSPSLKCRIVRAELYVPSRTATRPFAERFEDVLTDADLAERAFDQIGGKRGPTLATDRAVAETWYGLTAFREDFETLAKEDDGYRRASEFDKPRLLPSLVDRVTTRLSGAEPASLFTIKTTVTIANYDAATGRAEIPAMRPATRFSYSSGWPLDSYRNKGGRYAITFTNTQDFATVPVNAADAEEFIERRRKLYAELHLQPVEVTVTKGHAGRWKERVVATRIVKLKVSRDSNGEKVIHTLEAPPLDPPLAAPVDNVPKPLDYVNDLAAQGQGIRGVTVGMKADEFMKAAEEKFGRASMARDSASVISFGRRPTRSSRDFSKGYDDQGGSAYIAADDTIRGIVYKRQVPGDQRDAFAKALIAKFGNPGIDRAGQRQRAFGPTEIFKERAMSWSGDLNKNARPGGKTGVWATIEYLPGTRMTTLELHLIDKDKPRKEQAAPKVEIDL